MCALRLPTVYPDCLLTHNEHSDIAYSPIMVIVPLLEFAVGEVTVLFPESVGGAKPALSALLWHFCFILVPNINRW